MITEFEDLEIECERATQAAREAEHRHAWTERLSVAMEQALLMHWPVALREWVNQTLPTLLNLNSVRLDLTMHGDRDPHFDRSLVEGLSSPNSRVLSPRTPHNPAYAHHTADNGRRSSSPSRVKRGNRSVSPQRTQDSSVSPESPRHRSSDQVGASCGLGGTNSELNLPSTWASFDIHPWAMLELPSASLLPVTLS